ncbi:MAG: hypothetical protein M1816_004778 [Peltula sp. TS41687]|nr:MAG: hypothetical protein M1816_004778 [Peltula sp. TS41687]
MRKTLLLCFIHGFKGDDNTFGGFTEHLQALVSHALPKINVVSVVYPKFETRGDLKSCVGRFREWLQNRVIDIEVENKTPSPSIDPSVRTILVGHSMGGIVAAETVLEITSEKPLAQPAETHTFMFPYIQGILAFDTPYLGISPGVVAHGAEGHLSTASMAFTHLSGLVGGLWGGKAAQSDAETANEKRRNEQQAGKAQRLLTPPPAPAPAPAGTPKASGVSAAAAAADIDAAATPAWQRWGKIAMFAGAAGAVAAGGAAAYLKREQITDGWSWVGSHLEFVGCLMRGEELKSRLQRITELEKEGLGFADLYTVLGRGAAASAAAGKTTGGSVVGLMGQQQRTFCNLPKSELGRLFVPQVNDAARDETGAHTSMFFPRDNPGYYHMSEQGKALIVEWVMNDWYQSSTPPSPSPAPDLGVHDWDDL